MAKVVKLTKGQLAERLAELEREVGMPAADFYDRFRAGEMGDSPQVMTWAGLCYMALRNGLLTSSTSTSIAR